MITYKGLDCIEWELLEELVNLLKPFEEVTKCLSSNDSCISEVIPTIKTLEFCLSKRKVSSKLTAFKAALQVDIKIRFQDLESNLNFTRATFLDPRFKIYFLSAISLEDIKDCKQMTLIEGGNDQDCTGTELVIEDDGDTGEDIASKNDEDLDMEDCLKELISKATKNVKIVVTNTIKKCLQRKTVF